MQFRVVWDQLEECPYREGQVARLPLRLPLAPVTGDAFDHALAHGERRSGRMMYHTQCPACSACEPLRIPIARFQPSRSQRRVWARNEGEVRVEVGPPELTPERVDLYNRHKHQRGLTTRDEPLGDQAYKAWLVDSCTHTQEFRYYLAERLVAVSILDFGRVAASSVYHYFDPADSARSLGVYSILKELEVCGAAGFEWYYLGLFVEDCRHLAYKAGYWPHERRIAGAWQPFTRPPA